MHLRTSSFFLIFLLIFTPGWSQPGSAQTDNADTRADNAPLRVGVRPVAPFVIEGQDEQWRGLAVELWQQIAARTNRQTEWRAYDSVENLLAAVERGEVDVAVGALSVTRARERVVDFTHPFYITGLGIAVKAKPTGWWATVRALVSIEFLEAVGGLMLVILLFGFLIWFFERKKNPEQFERGWKGVGSGFWLSAVTMTTVGYGDKAPVSTGGRIVSFIWMFLALIIISGFTAAIASSLTVNQLGSTVQSADDLPRHRVGALAGSSTIDYLQQENIRHKTYATLTEAVNALAEDDLDAVVYDEALLRHYINTREETDLRILPDRLSLQYYGFALAEGSPLRESLNLALLDLTQNDAWEDLEKKYLGD